MKPSDYKCHATLEKFLFPHTLVKDYTNWILLCRKRQVTLGSLVLVCKDDAKAFGDISADSFAELKEITNEINDVLKREFEHDKINYLMLMMYDPDVHFHIFPRYENDKEFEGTTFKDAGWPEAPALKEINEISEDTFSKLIDHLKTAFAD